ncbi:type I-E CRISPR-associated protein Cse2/CasB [Arcanobacterium hippocoleae]|uniref:CRISPR type I-E-associated protein CasB/Cse2 n=1 Tax=Arcanobacterium hippocoleae TaxID=149017 RepID=A0ABU1T4D9_9ACTO|nr:type I-E CRISPR-associated protein Cse2/CasB [Arcanobacterium hippocoleae]MDR6939705.1 CRISPR type I-E-associated protein CasB/Cse2 [Arcanobacterium hippocoleae]
MNVENDETVNDIRFLYEILERRGGEQESTAEDGRGRSGNFRKQRANLRRGIDETTEHYAYPYVMPILGPHATKKQRTTLVRMAALTAEFVDVPPVPKEEKGKSFGRWCSEVSAALAMRRDGEISLFNPDKPDVVAQRLAFLHTQDFEEAFRSVWRLMQIAQSLKSVPACDYIAVYRLLGRWGNGISDESRSLRMRVLQDYYGNIDNAFVSDFPAKISQN